LKPEADEGSWDGRGERETVATAEGEGLVVGKELGEAAGEAVGEVSNDGEDDAIGDAEIEGEGDSWP
jgi:hypothetical protein